MKTKQKNLLHVLGITSVVLGFLIVITNCQNDSVIMKIVDSGGNVMIQPRVMIKQFNEEIKERKKRNETIPATMEKDERDIKETDFENVTEVNSLENVDLNDRLYFPYNLKIIGEVLKKLENEECVTDTLTVLESMTKHEKWALESPVDRRKLRQGSKENEYRVLFPSTFKFPKYGEHYSDDPEDGETTVGNSNELNTNVSRKHLNWLFDAFPKFPVGILFGNHYQLGNFDECIEARQIQKLENVTETVQGQYCLADIHFRPKTTFASRPIRSVESGRIQKNRFNFNNSLIHWGICLPSSCTRLDAEIFTKEVFASAAENFEVISVTVEQQKCYQQKPPSFSTLEIVYGCIVGFFLIFTALATGLHMWYLKQRKRIATYNVDNLRAKNLRLSQEIFKCFSIIHTVRKFLQIKPNELNLECICGIKFLSMSMIIVGHCMVFIFGGPVENKNFFQEEYLSIMNGPISNNALLVDTFLLISGFLMCRLLLLELDKRKGKLNILTLYVARYIRLTPSYMIVIGLHATWLYHLGSGPFWESKVGLERDRCLNSWWTNILYINNYVNYDKLCMFQSWYLTVDYHLFIIAPFIVYPLWRWRKIGETMLLVSTIVSMIIPFWITYKNQYDPTLMGYPPELADISTNFYFINVYIKTHMRASSYCIGLFFGYLVHKLQSSSIKIPSYAIYMGWIMSSCFALLSMYSLTIFFNPNHDDNSLESAIYASLHRTAWCLAIGWILVVCITDNADIINRFLSWKPFIPLSRLTYCAYLANGSVEIYSRGIVRQPIYLSKYELMCQSFAHLFLTFLLAFVLCIFFESPIHGIEKIVLTREKTREQKHNSTLRPLEVS